MSAKKFRVESGQNKVIETLFDNTFKSSIQDDLNIGYLNKQTQDLVGTPQNFEKTDYNFNHNTLTFNLYFFNDITDPVTGEFLKFINKSDWETPYYSELSTKIGSFKKPNTSIMLPSFYNSFSYLYSDPNNVYKNNFTRQSFFYDSFIRVDFYTTADIHTRKHVFTKLIYNNKRYLAKEYGYGGILQPRPTYVFDQECDGYVINWLSESPISELYAVFSYYDAFPAAGRTSAKRITLIPTPQGKVIKNKWVISSKGLNPEEFYVKYILDSETKTYSIKLYNGDTLNFDITTDNIDLTEFKTDNYWSNYNGYIEITRDLTAKTITLPNTKDNFDFTNKTVNIFAYHNTSEFEYNISPFEGLDVNIKQYPLTVSATQTLINLGESALKLVDVFISDATSSNDPLSGPGYRPNVLYSEKNSATTFTKDIYMYFDTAHMTYANNTLRSIALIDLYPAFHRNLVTMNDATDGVVKKQLSTKLSIKYPKSTSYELPPGQKLGINFDLNLGGKMARAFVPQKYRNTLFFSKILVTFVMKDSVGGQIVEKSFNIDFRLVLSRSRSRDHDVNSIFSKTVIEWANNNRLYNVRNCYERKYYTGKSSYTKNNLNNEHFNYINRVTEPTNSGKFCLFSEPVALTYKDYASKNSYDVNGESKYLITYDEYGNTIVTGNPNYQH